MDESEESYFIEDGDIPCTVGVEPTYSYVWNICGSITAPSFPPVCGGVISKSASAVQFLNRSTDGYNECEMIGEYNGVQDDASYSLLDISNPAKGVSITYTLGDRCGYHKDLYRSATIDIYCSDVEVEIQSAEEPSLCQYHFVMKSYYGCPLVSCAK